MGIEKNVGDMDRVLRVLIGLGLLLVAPSDWSGPELRAPSSGSPDWPSC